MEINFDELKDWSDGARRALDREREKLKEHHAVSRAVANRYRGR